MDPARYGVVPALLALAIVAAISPAHGYASLTFPVPCPVEPCPVFGPHVETLRIDISLSPTETFQKLKAGAIDLMDAPLSQVQIMDVLGMDGSEVDSDIALQSYRETGMFVMDVNNRCFGPHRFANATGHLFCDNGRGVITLVPSTSTYQGVTVPLSPWTENVEFRQALAHLFNREEIVRALQEAVAILSPSPGSYLGTDLDYTDPGANNFAKYPYSPSTAGQLLNSLGLVDTDGNGVRNDPVFNDGNDMVPLIFYVRLDDPRRTTAATIWKDAMVAAGITVDFRLRTRSELSAEVFRQQEYNVYTGGWLYLLDPDYLWDLYGPDFILPTDAFSLNYLMNANDEYWNAAYGIKFATNRDSQIASYRATLSLHTDLVVNIPAYANEQTFAFRKPFWVGTDQHAPAGARGVINSNGYGINNFFTILNAYRPDVVTAPYGGTLRWGFSSTLQDPNPVTYSTLLDTYLIGLLYDTPLARDPYSNPVFRPWLTKMPVVTSYSGTTPSGANCPLTACTKLAFDIPAGIRFHSYPSGIRLPGPDGVANTADDVILPASGAEKWMATT